MQMSFDNRLYIEIIFLFSLGELCQIKKYFFIIAHDLLEEKNDIFEILKSDFQKCFAVSMKSNVRMYAGGSILFIVSN